MTETYEDTFSGTSPPRSPVAPLVSCLHHFAASVCLCLPAQTSCSLPTDSRVHSKSVLWDHLLPADLSLRCLRLALAAPLLGAVVQHVQEGDPPHTGPPTAHSSVSSAFLEIRPILYLPGNLGHLDGLQPTFARPWLPGLCVQS